MILTFAAKMSLLNDIAGTVPHVLANTGEGHEIDLFLLISGTISFQALIKLITM